MSNVITDQCCIYHFVSVGLCVLGLKGKQLELPIPNFEDIQCMAVAWHMH